MIWTVQIEVPDAWSQDEVLEATQEMVAGMDGNVVYCGPTPPPLCDDEGARRS